MSESIVCNCTEIFPACRRVLAESQWQEFLAFLTPALSPAELAHLLADPALALPGAPPYLSDLARLELALYRTRHAGAALPVTVAQHTVNPSLQWIASLWCGLPQLLEENGADAASPPVPQPAAILVWGDPKTGQDQAPTAQQ